MVGLKERRKVVLMDSLLVAWTVDVMMDIQMEMISVVWLVGSMAGCWAGELVDYLVVGMADL